jgi:uncharacterized membrane protein
MFALRPAELHPIVVHFPIALLITSVALDVLALVLRRWHLVYGATWLLGFGVVGALAAGLTGSISAHAARDANVSSLLSLHQTLGFATGFVFAVLFVVRIIWLSPRILAALQIRQPAFAGVERQLRVLLPGLWGERISPLLVGVYLTGSLVGLVLLALTGYLGGALVYDHGVGTPAGVLLRLLWV